MRCVSCSKEIPITAKICPYCHRDTKESTEAHGMMMMLGIVGGLIGYLVNGWLGTFIGMVILGGIGGGIAFAKASSRAGAQPAKVSIAAKETDRSGPKTVPQTIESNSRASNSMASGSESVHVKRLATLEEMKAKGLVTAAEYSEKRQKILDEL